MRIDVAAPRHTALGIEVFLEDDGNWVSGWIASPSFAARGLSQFVGLCRSEDDASRHAVVVADVLAAADYMMPELQ